MCRIVPVASYLQQLTLSFLRVSIGVQLLLANVPAKNATDSEGVAGLWILLKESPDEFYMPGWVTATSRTLSPHLKCAQAHLYE